MMSFSKKDPAVRHEELVAAVSPALLNYICTHSREVVMNNSGLLLLLSVLKHASGTYEAGAADNLKCFFNILKSAISVFANIKLNFFSQGV